MALNKELSLNGLQKRLVIENLQLDTDDPSENITSLQSWEANLYVGTSKGRLAHYHQFEDAGSYMMISLLETETGVGGVRKMLILPTINTLMALVGGVLKLYALPELSPYHSKWKMELVVDVLLLAYSGRIGGDLSLSQTQAQPKLNDKLLAFTPTHIKIIQIGRDQLDVIKEIAYPNSIRGILISLSMTSNYSNLAIVANRTNYDIIDIRQIRKIPLFQYSPLPLARTKPFMIAYKAFDSGKEEYLLTVKSDESMSMAMIINSLGDVTRGTLTWIDVGYPTGGIVVKGSFVYGIFINKDKRTSKLVVSSLKDLSIVSEENIADLFAGQIDGELKEQLEDIDSQKDISVLASTQVPNETDKIENPKEDQTPTKEDKNKDEDIEVKDETLVQGVTEVNCEEVSPKEDIEEASKEDPTKDLSKETSSKVELKEEPENSSSKGEPPIDIEKAEKDLPKPPPTTPVPPTIHIAKTQCIIATDNTVSELLSKINLQDNTPVASPPLYMVTHDDAITLYDEKSIWILAELDRLTEIQSEIDNFVRDKNFEFILNVKNYMTSLSVLSDAYVYCLHLVFLAYVYLHDYDNAVQISLKLAEPSGALLISVSFVFLLCEHETPEEATAYKGIQPLFSQVKGSFQTELLFNNYCKSVYKGLSYNITAVVRRHVYKSFTSSSEILNFIEEEEMLIWKEFDKYPENREIFYDLQTNGYFLAIIYIAEIALEDPKQLLENRTFFENAILHTSLDLITKKSSDSSLDVLLQSKKYNFNLTQKVLNILSDVSDPKEYQKSLLELIEVSPAEGVNFIKRHNAPEKQSIHKHIMDILALKKNEDYDFGAIRLEFLETSFIDDSNNQFLAYELLQELTKKLNTDYDLEIVKNNFDIIRTTFSLECSLEYTIWPKVSWIDYIIIQSSKSEISDFLTWYVKVFELLLLTKQFQDTQEKPHLDFSLFEYLNIVSSSKEAISRNLEKLLEFNDFSAAEYYAIHGSFRVPLKPFYLAKWNLEEDLLEKVQPNLQQILLYYLKNLPNNHSSLEHMRHFVLSYGKEYFTPPEILGMLPDYTPIAFLASYIDDFIIGLNIEHEKTDMRKSLAKARLKELQQLESQLTVSEN